MKNRDKYKGNLLRIQNFANIFLLANNLMRYNVESEN